MENTHRTTAASSGRLPKAGALLALLTAALLAASAPATSPASAQAAYPAPSFSAAESFATGGGPTGIAAADFDGDGDLDLATSDGDTDTVSVLKGDGQGGFEGGTSVAAGGMTPSDIVAADLDLDGDADVAVANSHSESQTVSVLHNDGAGNLSLVNVFDAILPPRKITTADLNADGYPEIVTSNSDHANTGLLSRVSVLMGAAGDAAFSEYRHFRAGDDAEGIAVADANGDGKTDILAANTTSNDVSVLTNDGTARFATTEIPSEQRGTNAVTMGDFDKDGNADIAATNRDSAKVSVHSGDGRGGFSSPIDSPATTDTAGVTKGDFNGDGNPDLAMPDLAADNVTVLVGNGTARSRHLEMFPVGDKPMEVATGDFDEDGKTDIATANRGSHNVSVLLNDTVPPPPPQTAPVANADGYADAREDQTFGVGVADGVLKNDTDANGDPLTATLRTNPQNGSVAFSPSGAFSYTSNKDFNGTDSFTYAANDGNADSEPATVTITVAPANDAPVAVADAHETDEDEALSVEAPGVLSNDTDAEGDDLSAALVSGTNNGALDLKADGSLSYTPRANFNGSDSFTYRASDGTADGEPAMVTITVNPVDDPRPPATGKCTIKGTNKADVLRGTAKRDVICGMGGNDTLRGMGGNDLIMGNDGRDRLYGGPGNDVIRGGRGKDTIRGGAGKDITRQ